MAEAIHCPSCSTRYRLRPERLNPAYRRARCYSCKGEFPVGDIVLRMLAPQSHGATGAFRREDLASIQELELEPELEPEPVVALSPSLTLGDLEDVDTQVLESALLEDLPPLPEPDAEPSTPPASEHLEVTGSGYSSARDAIDKLFGTTPTAPKGLRYNQDASDMDMEATLSALESTLGNTPTSLPPLPQEPAAAPEAPAELTEEELAGPSTYTLRLSQAEMLAAIAAAEATSHARQVSHTEAPSDARTEILLTVPSPSPFDPVAAAPDPNPEQLRLKIGEEIYPSLTMAQLTAWVEEGRILENHLVARQHSENWLEAHKVPGLRPAFEKRRRERSGMQAGPDAGLGADGAPKKSLFGGLFGKG